MFNKEFWRPSLLYIILAELLSFGIFLIPELRIFGFILVSIIFLIVSLFDLRYGILIVLAELILGSKGGYLFSLEINDNLLSIRITFWIIILSVWFVKFFLPSLAKGTVKQYLIINKVWFKYFIVLMFFILWGLLNGFLNHNSFSNIFFDFNAYLYFLLILPLFSVLLNKDTNKIKQIFSEIIQVFSVSVFWLSIKTLILLFLFSHRLDFINSYLYSWIRSSGVGEITQIQGGFYRIFFQSHIFVLAALIAFFVFSISFVVKNKLRFNSAIKNKQFIYLFILLTLLSMTSLVSMSRSNWLGFVIAIFLVFIYSWWRFKSKGFISFMSLFLFVSAFSFISVISLVKFPYPKAIGGFDAGNLFTERAKEIKNEAGVSSRWNLLPKLSEEIKLAPLLGKGFGTTVTYISNDPRVRNNNIDGVYTTFAFEWGWLDIWLKLGLFGVLSYIVFLCIIIIEIFKIAVKNKNYNSEIFISFSIILFMLGVINFFSPYLNHPLGIGLILYSLFLFYLLDYQIE